VLFLWTVLEWVSCCERLTLCPRRKLIPSCWVRWCVEGMSFSTIRSIIHYPQPDVHHPTAQKSASTYRQSIVAVARRPSPRHSTTSNYYMSGVEAACICASGAQSAQLLRPNIPQPISAFLKASPPCNAAPSPPYLIHSAATA
jgi:hypothetical protein